MNPKDDSPFSPGNPVRPELFVGRSKQIAEIHRYVGQSTTGRLENVFLIGDRGIGKSSLASFVRHLVIGKNDVIGLHVFLGGVASLEEMVRQVFDQLLKRTRKQGWFDKISHLFGSHVRDVGLFGVSVTFSPPERDLSELVRSFPEALSNLLDMLKEERKGLFVALDDVNGLAETGEFANWYKSFADKAVTHYKEFPVFIMLIGLPEKRDRLCRLQPSLGRIFRVVEIEKLSDEEIGEFLKNAFSKVKIHVDPNALTQMVHFSSGLPMFMHEIGDATYWSNTDDRIDHRDAMAGIVSATESIGKKYLDPKVYNALRSKHYRSILSKLGQSLETRCFTKRDAAETLTPSEQRVFTNFLKKMRDLGVIESDVEKGQGAYKFAHEVYFFYIRMRSILQG